MSDLGPLDRHLLANGQHARLWERLGAHPQAGGVHFGVWAPNAESVQVISQHNGWGARAGGQLAPSEAGVWQGVLAGLQPGDAYKYRITSRVGGYRVDKADPVAFRAEVPPSTGSVVWPLEHA